MPNSWNLYQSFVDAFHRRFEVKDLDEGGATDALLNKKNELTIGDLEKIVHLPSFFEYPVPITCPRCRKDTPIGHLEWTKVACPACNCDVPRHNWIIRNPNK